MSKSDTICSERIELRAKPEIKSVLARAAQLRHTTISAYLLESGLERAEKDLKQLVNLSLNEADRDLFFTLLSKAPEPNEDLRALFNKGEM